MGLSGVRPMVDLVVPVEGIGASVSHVMLVVLAVSGIYVGRRREALVPWLAFLVSKVLVTLAFFGYARMGATVIPTVALLCCLSAERLLAIGRRRWSPPRRAHLRWSVPLALVVLLVAIEIGRWAAGPTLILDGRVAGEADPFPAEEFRTRRLEVR